MNSSPLRSSRRSPVSSRRRTSLDSPSRQLVNEFMNFVIETDRLTKAQLDSENAALEAAHTRQLEAAKTHHAAVAAKAIQAHRLAKQQQDVDRLKKELEEQEKMKKSIRELAEAEAEKRRREIEALETQEREQRERLEHEKQVAERKARLKENEDNARRERERTEREQTEQARARDEEEKAKAKQAAEAQAAAAVTAAAKAASPVQKVAPVTNTTSPQQTSVSTGPKSSSPLIDWDGLGNEHAAYIKLHGHLKQMRKHMITMYKQAVQTKKSTGQANPPIDDTADLRRQIQKLLGQLTQDSQKNKKIRASIRDVMRAAWNNKGVPVDARQFIINPSQPFPEGADTQVSGVFIYLVNVLIKTAMKLMPTSASILSYNAVDPIGVILTFMISLSEFRIHENSFADIYLAKYHRACPPLFGIFGPDNTQAGRMRLGWQRDKDDGTFIDPQTHYDRLNGVASGYAALTLRDFSRTRETNALPAWHYWKSLAGIVNIPPQQLTKSHAVILKGMIDNYAHHFVKFYGQAAVAALRLAIVQRPEEAPEKTGFEAVKVMRDNLKLHFGLDI